MYGLKDSNGIIVDVSNSLPVTSDDGILFNNCLYPQIGELSVVNGLPDSASPRKLKLVGVEYLPYADELPGDIGALTAQVNQLKADSADTTSAILDLYEILNPPA